jgi:hypothetical protein
MSQLLLLHHHGSKIVSVPAPAGLACVPIVSNPEAQTTVIRPESHTRRMGVLSESRIVYDDNGDLKFHDPLGWKLGRPFKVLPIACVGLDVCDDLVYVTTRQELSPNIQFDLNIFAADGSRLGRHVLFHVKREHLNDMALLAQQKCLRVTLSNAQVRYVHLKFDHVHQLSLFVEKVL